MEIPDALADSCKSYVNDVQQLIPVAQILIFGIGVVFSLLANNAPPHVDGLWLSLLTERIEVLLDNENWKALTGVDCVKIILATILSGMLFSIFQKIVFWAITSSHSFKSFINSQRTFFSGDKSDNKEKMEWLKVRLQKEMLPIRRMNLISELTCGVAGLTAMFGLFVALDIAVFFCFLTLSYVCIQSAAKSYVKLALPITLALSNLSGFVEKSPSTSR